MTKKALFFIILITSVVTLELQLLQTRILSVALWYHFVYVVITMALLGFAASGTVLFLSKRLKGLTDESFFGLALIGLSLSAFVSSKLGYWPVRDIFSFSPDIKLVLRLTAAYLILMLPYFFSGLIIGGAFLRFPKSTAKIYFINLIGSGLGCLVFILSIGQIGAGHLLTITALLGIAPLYLLLPAASEYKRGFWAWVIFLICILAFPEDSAVHYIAPEKHKQYWTAFGDQTRLEYSGWNPISRIDVVTHKKDPAYKHIVMDGDAMAWFYSPAASKELLRGGFIDRNLAYILRPSPAQRSLVIGAGGGFDVLAALFNFSQAVDAVEINPTTAYLLREKFSDHIENMFAYGNMNLFVEDGRSFIRRSPHKYDTIVIYYTDSFLALSTGAYTLSDNFLYTKEAFVDYLDHLSDTGFIQIGRWAYPDKPREALRIFSIALAACREKGYLKPSEHIVVVASGNKAVGNVIFKKTPFSRSEIDKLIQFCKTNGLQIWYPDILVTGQEQREYMAPFVSLARHFDNRTENEFFRRYEYDVTPTSDDSPFFYHYTRSKSAPVNPAAHWTAVYFGSIRGVWHIFILSFLFWSTLILSLVLVVLPLFFVKKKAVSMRAGLFCGVYFTAIGFAFMFLEMGLMQKFVLFLGSPIYSMSVVIPAILTGAGLGSLTSGMIKDDLRRWMAGSVLICGVLILLLARSMPLLSDLFLLSAAWMRIGIAIATLVPISFFMGFAFPLGLRAVSTKDGSLVPWAWAINGAASVIASVVAIMLAIAIGFSAVLTASACFYFLAGLSLLIISGREK